MLIRNIALSVRFLLWFAFAIVSVSISICAETLDSSAEQQIQTLISTTYDKPDQKVKTSPIAVVDEYAVADWTQGKRGGRALLHRSNGKWAILACGADGLKQVKTLTDAGISEPTAKSLVSQLTAAEQPLSSDLIKRFSLFGTKNDPISEEHH